MTYEEAHALFVYDPDTGLLTNRVSRRYGQIEAGTEAGSLDVQRGYRTVHAVGKLRKTHRVVWLMAHGAWPDGQIDHINGIKDDNRLCNLRDVVQSLNQRNVTSRADNTSKVAGVNWFRANWVARITTDERRMFLGAFDDWFEAVCARKSAEVEHGYTGRRV